MTPNTFEQTIAHLEILGYEIARGDRLVTAKHPSRCNIILSPLGNVVKFSPVPYVGR
jgi:hypothetical protein